jgi:WD repeat-containing protein 35
VRLHCISWNRDQGWIATGGDSGLLKVLKLEAPADSDAKLKGIAAPSNLSMNQTLEGHKGGVICVTWNPQYRKLTTSDAQGLIIVWSLSKGEWFSQMVNNRNKSVVRDMKWTSDGKKICIVYEDGAVIVGSVGGERLWGKEINLPLRFVEWSPDGKLILFVTLEAEVWVFDSEGSQLRSMTLAIQDHAKGDVPVAGIHWFSPPGGHGSRRVNDAPPALCIALENGMVQLSKNDEDSNVITFDTEMTISYVRWDNTGSILAVTGSQQSRDKTVNLVRFFDAHGQHLRNIRIPGESVSALAWEGSGLRLSLVVDSYIFFANVRPAYTWAYLLNTVVYTYNRSSDKRDTTVVFWDQITGDTHSKVVTNLKFLASHGDLCAVVALEKVHSTDAKLTPTKASKSENTSVSAVATKEVYRIQLRNAIGAILDTKVIPFAPKHVCMGPHHISAANDRTVYTWQYSGTRERDTDSQSESEGRSMNKGKERLFDIENTGFSSAQPPETFRIITDNAGDPVACLTLSDRFLCVARKSGSVTRYTLPHLSPENTYAMGRGEPFRIDLNCTSSRMSCVDVNGVFTIMDLETKAEAQGEEKGGAPVSGVQVYGKKLKVERRDVWDVKWAEDNAEMVCIMEKTKMVILRDEAAEDPVVSSGYLARFKDLEVRVVLLDELAARPDPPNKECVVDSESKMLREARDEIISGGLSGGYTYIDKNPHPRLWKLLAQKALEDLELDTAERAFVRYQDYYGVQLVKQLKGMPDKMKARAEVAVYLSKYDEAESIYREIDRKDLAISFRKRVGDHMRVVQLLQTGGGSDRLVRDAWDRIGQYYTDRFKWRKALQYFQLSRNLERLSECHYRLENFDELSKMRGDIADGTPLLAALAQRFEAVGMYSDAVDCYLRSGQPKAAVDCCVQLNRWDTAIELAEQHDFPQVEGLLSKYTSGLVSKGRNLEAVELYRRANRPTEAALLIGEIADKAANEDVKPSLAKKLHVLAALEIERHRKKAMDMATSATMTGGPGGTIAQNTAATLETLMMTALDTQGGTTGGANKKASKAFGNAWRGAAAYHYYILAQKQFYEGKLDAAMKTSIKLCEFDDILKPRDIYSLLCLTSLKNEFFGICSRAFVKLETLPGLSEKERDDVQTLAVKIFVNNQPNDPAILPEPYIKCLELGKSFKACIISGRAVQESETVVCKTCRHPMLENQLQAWPHKNCPLCHSPLTSQ